MRFFIHVGFPKTASTSIQRELAEGYGSLLEQGLLYPEFGRLRDGYRSHQPLVRLTVSKSGAQEAVGNIILEASASGAKRVVISSENFVQYPLNARNFLQALSENSQVEEVVVIALVREPKAYIESSYQQAIREGLWGISPQELLKESFGGITDYIKIFRSRFGIEPHDFDSLLKRISLPAIQKISTVVIELDGDKAWWKAMAKLLCVELRPLSYRRNSRISLKKLFHLRDLAKELSPDEYAVKRKEIMSIDHECNDVDMDKSLAVELDLLLPPEYKFEP